MKSTSLALVLVLVLSVGSLAGCGGKTPPQVLPPTAGQLPPAAESAILAGLESLQTLATVLGPVSGIPAKDTAAIISACAAAVQIVQADQTGWVSAVDEALSVLPAQLSPSTAATVQPYLDAISATIQALYGAGLS